MDMIFLHTYLLFEKTENKQKEASVEPFQQKQKGAGSGQIKNRPQLFSGNATRGCSVTGEWDSRTDYNNCRAIEMPTNQKVSEDFSVSIYFVGYILSLLALTLALSLFLSFRLDLFTCIDHRQCDQIGQFKKVLCIKFSYKSSPNIYWLLGLFWKTSLYEWKLLWLLFGQ